MDAIINYFQSLTHMQQVFVIVSMNCIGFVIIVLSIIALLLLPTFPQIFKRLNLQLIFVDAVKVIKYVASFIAFLYFRRIFINKGHLLKWIYRWILFSFIVLVINIFLKLIGK